MDGVIPGLLTALGFVKERSSSNEDSIMVERCIQMHKKTPNSENVSKAARVLARPLLVDLCRMPKEPSTTSRLAIQEILHKPVYWHPELIDRPR